METVINKKDYLGWVKPITTMLLVFVFLNIVFGKKDAYIPMTAAQIASVLGYVPMNAANITLTTSGTTGASTYNGGTAAFNIPNYTTGSSYTAGMGISIASNVITNSAPDQTVSLTAGNAISASGTYPNFTVAVVQPTISYPTRTLNTTFTISTTKAAFVSYSISGQVTNPLLVGSSTASDTLKYSLNGGTTYTVVASNGISSSVGITVTLQLTQGQGIPLSGYIPANALVKVVSATTGTGSVTFNMAQETVY